MALIKCRECGREISSAAPTCPGCGHPQRRKINWDVAWKPLVFAGAVVVALAVFLQRSKPTSGAAAGLPVEMRVTGASPVCRDDGLYNEVLTLVVKKNLGDAEMLLAPAVANNQCQVLDAGQQVTIEKGTRLPCVRWNGEPECWYISPTLIEVIP
jgi:hypothetical protein